MRFIDPGNSVWFHDHAEGYPCTPNCYAHVDSPASAFTPVRYFLRFHGFLREVRPLTKPCRESGGTVLVEVVATREVLRVDDNDLIRR